MDTKVITVTNTKGGCGKTTISMQLAAALARRGNRILVIDADSTAGAIGWATAADEDAPFPATVVSLAAAGAKLHLELKKFLGDYDHIIIDCPPATESQAPRSALLVSDLAIIPMIPSAQDLRQSSEVRRLIDDVTVFNDTLIVRLLANGVLSQTLLARDVLDVLPSFGIPMFEGRIGQRNIYRSSAAVGRSVFDFPSKSTQAIAEIDKLASEVVGLLARSEQAVAATTQEAGV